MNMNSAFYKNILEDLIEYWDTVSTEQSFKKRGGRGINLMVIENTITSVEDLRDDVIKNDYSPKLLGKINGFLIRLKTYRNLYLY